MLIFVFSLIGMLVIAICLALFPLINWPLVKAPLFKVSNKKLSSSLLLPGLLFIIIPMLICGLYYHWGNFGAFKRWYTTQLNKDEIKKLKQELKTPEVVIARMRQHLIKDPNSAEGWYLLGRLYFSLAKYRDAVEVLAKAYALQPQNEDIRLQYAQSLFFAQDQQLQGVAKDIIDQTLLKQPYNLMALNLKAIDAYHKNDFQTALDAMKKILPAYKPGSVESTNLLQLITQTQYKISATHQPVQVVVIVKLAKSLRNQVTAQEKVFIYAKAVTGPPMPLAIVQKQVSDIPCKVILDDSTAMLKGMNLSNFTKVKIIARVSPSGQALPQTGDLIGQSSVVELANVKQPVTVEIADKYNKD